MGELRFDPSIVRAIAFDGFGTIFEYPAARYKETFERIGATLAPKIDGDPLWKRWLEVGRKQRDQGSPEEGPRHAVETPPFRPYRETWPLQFTETFASLQANGDPLACTTYLIDEIKGAGAYPEAPAVLAAVRSRYPIALVSNADDAFLHPPLETSRLQFDAVISSETVQSYKPDSPIFERTAADLGVPLAAILYVGDSLRADVAGAVRAGLQVAWLDRAGSEPQPDHNDAPPEPHLRITTLDALLPALGIAPLD